MAPNLLLAKAKGAPATLGPPTCLVLFKFISLTIVFRTGSSGEMKGTAKRRLEFKTGPESDFIGGSNSPAGYSHHFIANSSLFYRSGGVSIQLLRSSSGNRNLSVLKIHAQDELGKVLGT